MSKKIEAPTSIAIQRTELSNFDDTFSFLKEKFRAEMLRMEEEMNNFSVNLLTAYGQQGSSNQGPADPGVQSAWDALAKSPLIQENGDQKTLKLQFDMSNFDPNEIHIEMAGDRLSVIAHHELKTGTTSVTKDYKKEFVLPHGMDMKGIVSTLSRDGVLTIQAALPMMTPPPGIEMKSTLTKNPGQKGAPKTADPKAQAAPTTADLKVPFSVSNQVPQDPMATESPASPRSLPTSPAATQRDSKVSSKSVK